VEDQQLKREFTASNDSAVAAFENYKTYLEQELKPKADGDFALGSDLFAKRIAYNEMVDIPPDRLLDIAYAQLQSKEAVVAMLGTNDFFGEGCLAGQKSMSILTSHTMLRMRDALRKLGLTKLFSPLFPQGVNRGLQVF
jgi:hypothetical protein